MPRATINKHTFGKTTFNLICIKKDNRLNGLNFEENVIMYFTTYVFCSGTLSIYAVTNSKLPMLGAKLTAFCCIQTVKIEIGKQSVRQSQF